MTASVIGWKGELVRLVPLDEGRHLENFVLWLNDPEVTEWLLIGDLPLTRLAEEEYFRSASGKNEGEIIFAIETLDGRHIGGSGLHSVSYRNRCASSGSFLGETSSWGKGIGTDACRVRARYAFDVLGLERIFSSHLSGNERSRRMLLRCGYRECGVLPKRYWKRGALRDEHLFVLEREDWLVQGK